jgi:hypothetical protein
LARQLSAGSSEGFWALVSDYLKPHAAKASIPLEVFPSRQISQDGLYELGNQSKADHSQT